MVRPGRTIELVEATVVHADRPVLVARVWRLVAADTASIAGGSDLPIPADLPPWDMTSVWPGGYIGSLDVRRAADAAPGRATTWVTSPLALVDGVASSTLARYAMLVDTANGTGVRQDPRRWMFPNVDLTIHLHRQPVAGPVGLETTVTFGPTGQGLTHSVLHDTAGPTGPRQPGADGATAGAVSRETSSPSTHRLSSPRQGGRRAAIACVRGDRRVRPMFTSGGEVHTVGVSGTLTRGGEQGMGLRTDDDLHPVDAVRLWVVTGEPDPRVLQTAFAVFVAVDFLIRGVGGDELGLAAWPGAGLALTGVTTILAFVVPWRRLGAQQVSLLPVLDIAALGAVRMSEQGSAAGILVVVPALWLGRLLGRRGALVVLVAVATLAALPSMVLFGTDALAVSRALLITVVAGWSALAIAYSLERIRTERDEAHQRGEALAAALATIEQHRRASEAIFDAVDIGLLLLDRDGRFRGHNRRQEAFFRLADPDGRHGRIGEAGPAYGADGRPLAEEETPTYRAARGEEFEDHRTWVGPDPLNRRVLSVSARSLRGPEGEFEGAALTCTEVTELIRVERALADTTERYRSLFDYNPNAVFSLDLAGRFVASNAASQALCGYSLEELG